MTRDHFSGVAEFATCRATPVGLTFIRCMLASLLLVPGGLPAQVQAERPVGYAAARSCVDFRVTDVPARIDDENTLYVEQEAVSSQRDGRVLVAGQPVFLWHRTGTRHELVEQDSLIGMVITPPSKVRPVLSPLRGRALASMRSVALPDGWWLVTFAEIERGQSMQLTPKVLALWAAETDGATWRNLEKLPTVIDSVVLIAHSASQLSYRNGRVLFAIQSERNHQPRVVMYERDSSGWSAASMHVGRRAYLATAMTESTDVLAVVRNDSTEREDTNSLFLYTRAHGDTSWVDALRLVRGYRTPVRDPRIDARSDGLLLTWRVTSEDGRAGTGYSVRLNSQGQPTAAIRRLSERATLFYHAARDDRGVWIGSNGQRGVRDLELLEHDSSSAPIHSSVSDNTYGGILGAAVTGELLVVIASQPAHSPEEPAVVSIIKSYPWRCN